MFYFYHNSSYDVHQKKLMQMQDELNSKRANGVRLDPEYRHYKNVVKTNKLKTHEFQE